MLIGLDMIVLIEEGSLSLMNFQLASLLRKTLKVFIKSGINCILSLSAVTLYILLWLMLDDYTWQ